MAFWSHIKTLNLNDAYLTTKGAGLIFTSLPYIQDTIEHLYFQYNGIKESELEKLIAILPQLTKLKLLYLNGNAFDPDCALVEQLNTVLERLEKEAILDSLSDMEHDDDESEEEEITNEEEETMIEKEKEFEDLAQLMSNITVEEKDPPMDN